jgi:hypothetical protein
VSIEIANPMESSYLARVKMLPCVLCAERIGRETMFSEAHHLLGENHKRVSHYLTIPLCEEHHRGKTGVHGVGGRRGFERRWKTTEQQLLGLTIEMLERMRHGLPPWLGKLSD